MIDETRARAGIAAARAVFTGPVDLGFWRQI